MICLLTVLRVASADTLFGADLTIMEEGTELLHRLKAHLEQVGWQDSFSPSLTARQHLRSAQQRH